MTKTEDDTMHDGWMNWGQGGWSGMWFGPLVAIGVLVSAAVLIFALMRARGRSIGTTNSTRTPRQILDERFARGEINREEFEQRRKAVEA